MRSRSRQNTYQKGTRQPGNIPNPPAYTTKTQIPTQGQGFMSTMVTGMALGAGSEIAHQAVRGVVTYAKGDTQQNHITPNNNNYSFCQQQQDSFISCLKTNSTNIDACQQLLDSIKNCSNTNQF